MNRIHLGRHRPHISPLGGGYYMVWLQRESVSWGHVGVGDSVDSAWKAFLNSEPVYSRIS
jgi:hypothetical protein